MNAPFPVVNVRCTQFFGGHENEPTSSVNRAKERLRHTVLVAIAISIGAAASSHAKTHPSIGALTIDDIGQAFRGKTCTTVAGAKFTFGQNGEYSYEGLWKNAGRYSIGAGSITILLDSGLERSFAISRKGGVFYMEETAISCR